MVPNLDLRESCSAFFPSTNISFCIWFPAHYSIAGGRPCADTNLIPDQLLETAHLLSTNICGSSPQFDGKCKTSAPLCSSLCSHSLIPGPLPLSLSLWCLVLRRSHLLLMISKTLTFIHRGSPRQKKKTNVIKSELLNLLYFFPFGNILEMTLRQHVFHTGRLNSHPFDSSQWVCRCLASHLFTRKNRYS